LLSLDLILANQVKLFFPSKITGKIRLLCLEGEEKTITGKRPGNKRKALPKIALTSPITNQQVIIIC